MVLRTNILNMLSFCGFLMEISETSETSEWFSPEKVSQDPSFFMLYGLYVLCSIPPAPEGHLTQLRRWSRPFKTYQHLRNP